MTPPQSRGLSSISSWKTDREGPGPAGEDEPEEDEPLPIQSDEQEEPPAATRGITLEEYDAELLIEVQKGSLNSKSLKQYMRSTARRVEEGEPITSYHERSTKGTSKGKLLAAQGKRARREACQGQRPGLGAGACCPPEEAGCRCSRRPSPEAA